MIDTSCQPGSAVPLINLDPAVAGPHGFREVVAGAIEPHRFGPDSEGAVGGGGRYGIVDVRDDGGTIGIELRAERRDGTALLEDEFEAG